jgi:small GTP-binding protein
LFFIFDRTKVADFDDFLVYIFMRYKQMGGFFSALHAFAFGNKRAQILILGLDASGKTTIIHRIKTGNNIITVPTIGFNTETFVYGNLTFSAFDLGGQDQIRKLWHHYYPGTDAIVFIVDSADKRRFPSAKYELDELLKNPVLRNIPFLIFANKQDLPRAATTSDVATALQLFNIKDRKWKIAESIGTSGVGIDEGFEWLSKTL